VGVPKLCEVKDNCGPKVWFDLEPVHFFVRKTLIILIISLVFLYQVLVCEFLTLVLFVSAKLKEPRRSKVEKQTHLNLFRLSDQVLLMLLVELDIVLHVEA
jgi:hypothetical protein